MAALTATPLGPAGGFNWVFLVELLVCGFLAVFFLFYFNRLFATVISYAIRAWTWHKYKAYIDISSLQISLLGGRLFFKTVRYHGHNETILVHDGHVTWRYWLRQVQEAEIFLDEPGPKDKERSPTPSSGSRQDDNEENDEKGRKRNRSIGKEEKATNRPKKELPCRISVKVSGVEAFLYNRSPAYDGIVEQTLKKAAEASGKDNVDVETKKVPSTGSSSSDNGGPAEKTNTASTGRFSISKSMNPQDANKPDIPAFLRLLPVKIECKKAAAAVGNQHTTSVITAKLETASGTIDAGASGPLDLYKLLFNFEFNKVLVQMKPNIDYKSQQLDAARSVLRDRELEDPRERRRHLDFNVLHHVHRRWKKLINVFKLGRKHGGSIRTASLKSEIKDGAPSTLPNDLPPGHAQWQPPGHVQWQGLTRYIDDGDRNEHDEWEPVEYAKSSTLADIEKVGMKFYWDLPGTVRENAADSDVLLGSDYEDDMNGTKPPDYGLDLFVYRGVIVYGPWADRQRINLQHIFFPAVYVDAVEPPMLRARDTRVSTVFQLFLSVEEEVILRIPTREPSKDFRWQGRSNSDKPPESRGNDASGGKHGRHHHRKKSSKWRKGKSTGGGADVRPFAWLDVKVKKDSTVNYVMDMFCRRKGYHNAVDLDVKGTEIESSVNHGLLWRAGPLAMEADLSNPKEWNTLRKWDFKITCDDLELFILRDHMFLITDLVQDWSSGPPPDFYTFIPFYYGLDLNFRNFKLLLNTNDANIINNPSDMDSNDFLPLQGRHLHADLGIPLEHFRPARSEIWFDVLAQDMSMDLLNPSRNTLKTLLKDKRIAELPRLTLKGTYNSAAETAQGLTDILQMDLVGTGLSLSAYGFLVRHFINVKENYFGDYIHFKTLEEFQGDGINAAASVVEPSAQPTPANDLDVILCIVAEQATIMLPTNMYSAKEFVRIELPTANVDLRITNYYMDLAVNFAPLSILLGQAASAEESPRAHGSGTQLYVSQVELMGHRLFGLSPEEPAYCNTWDVDVGTITGECSSSFIEAFARAGSAFAFTFADGENALPIANPVVIHDVVFLRLKTQVLRVWLHVGKDALLVSSDPVSVDFHDWAGANFSQRLSLMVPNLTVACVDGKSASRKRAREGRKRIVQTYAFLQTSVTLNMVQRKLHFAQEREAQQAHIRKHDMRTHRTQFLLLDENIGSAVGDSGLESNLDPPAMPYPGLPLPLDRSGREVNAEGAIKFGTTSLRSVSMKSKSSSLSLAGSVRRQTLAVPQDNGRADERPRNLSPGVASSNGSTVRGRLSRLASFSGRSSNPSDPLPSDDERARFGLPSSTMAFSSAYAGPYFPLEMIEPDQTNVPQFETVRDTKDSSSDTSCLSEEISDPDLDVDSEHTTILLKLEPGIRAYVEPHVADTVAELIRLLQPQSPEDILDAYQTDVLTTITSRQQQRHGKGMVLELNLSLPAAHFRAINYHGQYQAADQIDMSMQKFNIMTRTKKQPAERDEPELLAIHLTLNAMSTSLRDSDESGRHKGAAVHANLNNVLIWVAVANARSLHVSFRELEILTLSQQARYLATLTPRVLSLVDDLKPKFASLAENKQKRLHLLIRTLTMAGEDVGDPPFLTRMTYVLRAFPDHFRNQESWKIISRFRHILQSLPKDKADTLASRCKDDVIECRADTSASVLQTWAQWRNWDVPNINQTLAFRMLFSDHDVKALKVALRLSTGMTLRTSLIRVAIDPGPHACEVLVEETSLGLDITPPTRPTGLMLLEENKRTKSLIQLHTDSISIRLDWSIYDAVETILDIQRPHIVNRPDQLKRTASTTQVLDDTLERHDFHVVVSTDNGSIALHSINLRHKSKAEGLKMSLIGTTHASDQYGQCVSALINAKTATTQLHGQSRRVWDTKLTSPSIYVDHLKPADGVDKPATINLAAAYGELDIQVKQEILSLIELVDSVILDEVVRVQRLVKTVQRGSQSQETSDTADQVAKSTDKPPKIYVALLAGNLKVDLALLQALSYSLSGKSASIRVAPNMSQVKTFAIDFDVGSQVHSLVNHSSNEEHRQGLLDLPPINGHVGLHLSDTETSVTVATTVQRLHLEAAALQGILTIVNRPEVQHVISAIKSGIDEVKEHVQSMLPGSVNVPRKPTEAKPVFFDVRAALLGLKITANAPVTVNEHAVAELMFLLGPIHATASNRVNPQSAMPSLPEVRAKVQEVGASLSVRDRGKSRPCGNITLSAFLNATSHQDSRKTPVRDINIRSQAFEVNIYAETASTVVDVINHLQDKIKDVDLTKEVEYVRKLRETHKHSIVRKISGASGEVAEEEATSSNSDLIAATIEVELTNIQLSWLVGRSEVTHGDRRAQDLVLSLARVDFRTRKGNEARLTIQDLQLQLVPEKDDKIKRSLNSALLPEVVFTVAYWSSPQDRKLAFKASGEPLDLRLESRFMLPVSVLEKSITSATERFRTASATWQMTPTTSGAPRTKLFGNKRLSSLLVEANFAGAEVYLQGAGGDMRLAPTAAVIAQERSSQHGRYGQFAADNTLMSTTLRAPGVAVKVEHNDDGLESSIHGELRVDASKNILYPNVVPLILEISNSVKEVFQDAEKPEDRHTKNPAEVRAAQKSLFEDDSIINTDPSAIFGKTKVNLGLRICRQEFGLSCQPIARVDAKALLDDLYVTVNTIDSEDHGHFFAVSAQLTNLSASVKHVYSKDPTFSFDMESIVLSLMNSRHLSGVSGISAILKINPTKTMINAKQLQDLLLFREIWVPPEIRHAQQARNAPHTEQPEDYLVQRYQSVSAAAAFPWNATVAIADLAVELDLGQSIGKSSFSIHDFWASSQKSSNWEQNLCVGMEEMAINSTGRMSGFVRLGGFGGRTSIKWPKQERITRQTPLIQASLGFQRLRAKAAFDYQPFAFADIEGLDFLMYNVHGSSGFAKDRLVAVLDCEKAFVFCTSTSPAQAVGLVQAFERLIQEKQTAYKQSLKDIEKHLRRESTIVPTRFGPQIPDSPVRERSSNRAPISLHTDVVLTLGTISFGAFPGTFFDSQILKLEASNIQARFAVGIEQGKIHSGLGMTLGQLQVALASVKRVAVPKTLGDITVDEVITNAVGSKGGTILRVPKVVASMQTWQVPEANNIDYIFKSLFAGKVDVGWNYSRISFIRGMWETHSRSLASRLGKPLPESAVKITAAGPQNGGAPTNGDTGAGQEKITAVVNMPQSKYEYRALETPIIETPQLRDMGEATPPLEWIGLHRDRLPNVIHQIILVSLLQVAKEVEDAYERILGSS